MCHIRWLKARFVWKGIQVKVKYSSLKHRVCFVGEQPCRATQIFLENHHCCCYCCCWCYCRYRCVHSYLDEPFDSSSISSMQCLHASSISWQSGTWTGSHHSHRGRWWPVPISWGSPAQTLGCAVTVEERSMMSREIGSWLHLLLLLFLHSCHFQVFENYDKRNWVSQGTYSANPENKCSWLGGLFHSPDLHPPLPFSILPMNDLACSIIYLFLIFNRLHILVQEAKFWIISAELVCHVIQCSILQILFVSNIWIQQ